MCYRVCSNEQFIRLHLKNKAIFFKEWLSTWCLDSHLAKSLRLIEYFQPILGVSIKGLSSGKLTGCEDDFAYLVWPSKEKFSFLMGRYELNKLTSLPSLHSSVGRALHRYCRVHRFESRWSPDFFQASSFQLLKLENILRWSFFTFIYNRSSYIFRIYMYITSFHSSREDMNSINWLHSICFIAQ